jgi:hypothetical protein
MKVLLRDHRHRMFLSHDGRWTLSVEGAMEFRSGAEAISFSASFPFRTDVYFYDSEPGSYFSVCDDRSDEAVAPPGLP